MTKSLGLLLIALLAATGGACAARGGVPRPFPVATRSPETAVIPTDEATASTDVQAGVPSTAPEARSATPGEADSPDGVVRTALAFIGIPYRNGGSDPSGFDCSGFVQYVFARHGEAMPREVRDQYQHGHAIDLDDVRPGDLVFFETVSRGASHVGIALGDGRFVHAPSSRGVVRVEPYTASYWARRFVGARRMTGVAAAPERGAFPGAIQSSR